MNLRDLIEQWLKEHHPTTFIADGTVCMPIEGPIKQYGLPRQSGDVWYVCRIADDHIRLFKPASEVFGASLSAGLPNFFETVDGIVKFYHTYAP